MNVTGSRWWKFDFHTHSPASVDYAADSPSDRDISPKEWLKQFIAKGIECVALTDHNTGSWIDQVLNAAEELRLEGHSIFLFPGVEITAQGNTRIIGIFDANRHQEYISGVVGAVQYDGSPGDKQIASPLSPKQVIQIIIEKGGLAIPAAIDNEGGICTTYSADTLEQILKQATAVEVACSTSRSQHLENNVNSRQSTIESYRSLKLNLSEVIGSNCYKPSDIGLAYTWVKMSAPNIDGLRLALLDGTVSIRRSDEYTDNPNRYPENCIQSINLNHMRYCGQDEPLVAEFHPWLTTIIGGRGSGKSSLVEFLRLGLGRCSELLSLSEHNEIRQTFEKFAKKPTDFDGNGVLTDQSVIEIGYQKNNCSYRLTWSFNNAKINVEKLNKETQEWHEEEGDLLSRFPAKIFSQKQIFDIAKHPNSLLKIIDDSKDVNRYQWQQKWDTEKNRFLRLRNQQRDLVNQLQQAPIFKGQLSDITHKIELYEQSDHQQQLQSFERAANLEAKFESYKSFLNQQSSDFAQFIKSISAPEINYDEFNSIDTDLINNTKAIIEFYSQLKSDLQSMHQNGSELIQKFSSNLDQSLSFSEVNAKKHKFKKTIGQLSAEGIEGFDDYQNLLNEKKNVQDNLNALIEIEKQLKDVTVETQNSYSNLLTLRKDLFRKREELIKKNLSTNRSIKVSLLPFSDLTSLPSTFKETINLDLNDYDRDIYQFNADGKSGFLLSLNEKLESIDPNAEKSTDRKLSFITKLKKDLISPADITTVFESPISDSFNQFRKSLTPEQQDQLFCWFPEDRLQVNYFHGEDIRDISQGSAGQKAATILSFLLSFGNDPLILDQPEDDLDNDLIYRLIVNKLTENKSHRQVIIVTHNPNIVVNGDAEYIFALREENGKTKVLSSGGLQEPNVRQAVCNIMEGGTSALQKRYLRIMHK